jgi:hypothetical protein
LIKNNRNLMHFLMLMDLRENCGDPQDGDEGRILPKAGNEEHFRWCVRSGKVLSAQSSPH